MISEWLKQQTVPQKVRWSSTIVGLVGVEKGFQKGLVGSRDSSAIPCTRRHTIEPFAFGHKCSQV